MGEEKLYKLIPELNTWVKIPLKTISGYEFLNIKDIIRIESIRNNCMVYYIGSEKPLRVISNLIQVEDLIEKKCFFRSHRSHLVNMDHVVRFIEKERKLVTANGDAFIAEDRLKEFKTRFLKCKYSG